MSLVRTKRQNKRQTDGSQGAIRVHTAAAKPDRHCPLLISSQTSHLLCHLIQLKCFTILLHNESQ